MKRLLSTLLMCIGAILLSPLLLIGFIFDLVYRIVTFKFKGLMDWFLDILKELADIFVWFAEKFAKETSDWFYYFALAIDYLGNVLTGTLIQSMVTTHKETLLGRPLITISAAIGELKINNKLDTKFGVWLAKVLDKVFEPNHCTNSYDDYLTKLTNDTN